MSTVGMPQTTVRYLIDGKKSTFVARAFATGVLSAFGHSPTITIPDFDGQIVVDPEAIERSAVRLVIQAASLAVADDIREKDREEINRSMHKEVLESESYPEIVYECPDVSAEKTGEGQYRIALAGELTLHGVQRSQSVAARVALNGDVLRATGEFSLRQSDYEIRPVSAAGGTIKLKDELKFSFDISARKRT